MDRVRIAIQHETTAITFENHQDDPEMLNTASCLQWLAVATRLGILEEMAAHMSQLPGLQPAAKDAKLCA